MFAIIQTAGHQVRVKPGQHIDVDRLGAETGAEVTFDQVLFVSRNDGSLVAGSPAVRSARVVGVVDAHPRGPQDPRLPAQATEGHATHTRSP